MLLVASAAFAATPSFYPGEGPQRVALDPDGSVRGLARTGDLLVKADDPVALAALPEVAAVRVLRGRVARLVLRPGVDDVALAARLHDRDDVAWAHPNLRIRLRPASVPDDPYLASQWHLQNTGQLGFVPGVDIGAPEAWDLTTGAGQIVAILDSGVDLDHPDLLVLDGHDYVDQDESSDPTDEAHGTACAGLAVGRGDNGLGTAGVAYDAQAYGIRLIGATTLQDLYDAFVEATDAGASVLSNSWGYEDDCAGVDAFGIVTEAFAYAEANGRGGLGSAVVFAVGNGNCDISEDLMLADPAVIGVAAVNGYDLREPYSSFGAWVDVAAPSGSMATTDLVGGAGYNGYPGDDDYTGWFSGTSASTPVVAGTLALMFAANERLTAADARDALCATAVRVDLEGGDYDVTGWSPYYGCGRIHAGAAVRAVANVGPPSVPVPTVDEVPPDAAVLAWDAATDPDGDHVSYVVRWWTGPDPIRVETERTFLDLTGQVADGDVLSFEVRAVDPWGGGEWSKPHEVRVVTPPPPPPPPETGCAHAGGPPAAIGLAALALARRRRLSRTGARP